MPSCFLAPALFAQQTGGVIGTVTATDGAVLPGATVEARSDVLPGPRVTVTAANGDYRLPALPPGALHADLQPLRHEDGHAQR